MSSILLIDDDDLLRGVLAKALAHAGHHVVEAADGRAGCDALRGTPVDIVVTDLIMPGQEGVETILQLRREFPGMPVIAMSGAASNSRLYLEIAGKIGASRTLEKPFKPQDLLITIEDVLAGRA